MRYDTIIKRLNDYAVANYGEGWDGWVECLSLEDKLDLFHGVHNSYEACYAKAIQWVADFAQSDAIRAENCALYDENPEYYKKLQVNAKARNEEAFLCNEEDLVKDLPYNVVKIEF
jgi:predicted ferric reductase